VAIGVADVVRLFNTGRPRLTLILSAWPI